MSRSVIIFVEFSIVSYHIVCYCSYVILAANEFPIMTEQRELKALTAAVTQHCLSALDNRHL